MSAPRLEDWLKDQGAARLDLDPPPDGHISDARLAALAEGSLRLARGELAHLAACPACREVAAALIESTPAVPAPRSRWWWWAVPAALAATLIIGLASRPGPEEEWQVRGAGDDAAAPAFVVIADDGRGRRVLSSGDTVRLGGRLSFQYGNVGGRARDLTVLGWDGVRLHWFAPATPDGRPLQIARGPTAINQRLPFDIVLDSEHRAGPLTVLAAFDATPRALAAALRADRPPQGAIVLRLRLEAKP